MCSNHETSVCKSAEASLKGSLATLKHLRADAQELTEKALAELRLAGVDTQSAEHLIKGFTELFDQHQQRAETKTARVTETAPVLMIAKS